MSKKGSILTVANILTIARIFLTPVLMLSIFNGQYFWTLIFIIFGGLTDFFDGFAARYFNETSDLGELLDPVADKVFMSGMCIALVLTSYPLFVVPLWFVILLCARDAFLLWSGLWVLKNGFRISLQPTLYGKISTALFMIGISLLCFQYLYSWHAIKFHTIFWIICAFFNLGSGLHYILRGIIGLLKRA